jgi:hypothetical protein
MVSVTMAYPYPAQSPTPTPSRAVGTPLRTYPQPSSSLDGTHIVLAGLVMLSCFTLGTLASGMFFYLRYRRPLITGPQVTRTHLRRRWIYGGWAVLTVLDAVVLGVCGWFLVR